MTSFKLFFTVFLFSLLTLYFTSCDKIDAEPDLPDDVQDDEIVAGLKEALRVGTDTSVSILNRTDGFYEDLAVKLFLPPEAKVIQDNISLVPGGDVLIDELILKINRVAEDAAGEATPIFVDAITNMTIEDGLSILNGEDTAATHYLKENTYNSLYDLFKPEVESSLGKNLVGGVSAESAYEDLVNTYNDGVEVANLLPGNNYPLITENSLSEYTTNRALFGLFLKVADEEKAIRNDPFARVTDILEKVFGED